MKFTLFNQIKISMASSDRFESYFYVCYRTTGRYPEVGIRQEKL